MLSLKGKVAIVTGAGSVGPGWGNGKATAVLLARQGAKVSQSAGVGELTATLERFADGDGVGGLAERRQLANGIENDAVVRAVKILGTKHVGDVVPGLRIEEQAA